MTFGKIFGWLSALAIAAFVIILFATIIQGGAERRAAKEKQEAEMAAIREAAQKRTSAMQINAAQIQQIVEKIAAMKPIPTGQVSKKDPTPKVTNADMDRFYDAKMIAMLELIRVATGMCPDPKVDTNELNQVVASTIWEEGLPKLCNGVAPYPGFPAQPCRVSSAGCHGLTQICSAFAETYGIDADGDGTINVDTMADAVFSTANFYCKSGGATDKAILAYNHSTDYKDKIRRGMERYGKLFANAPAPEEAVAAVVPQASAPQAAMPAGTAAANGILTKPAPDRSDVRLVESHLHHMVAPISEKEGTVVSIEGEARSGGARAHAGLDIAVKAQGVPVYAPADGTVIRTGWHHDSESAERAGYYIQVECNTQTKREGEFAGFGLSHLMERDIVRVGETVNQTKLLGFVGRTAVNDPNTPTHLHFQVYVWKNGKPVIGDPFDFIDFATQTPGNSFYAGPLSPDQVRSYADKFKRIAASHGPTT